MFDAHQLAAFLATIVAMVILPGPNTMIILAHSLAGRRAGFATILGVELGTMVHTLAVAIGLSALIAASPAAFTVVKYAGVAYLIFAGVKALLQRAPAPSELATLGTTIAFRRALVTNLLNPKSIVFFVAFLPQFVRPEHGRLFLQFLLLGILLSCVGLFIGAIEVLAAASLSAWLRGHASFAQWQQRVTGAVFIAIGVIVAMTAR
ncbi:MAG TPA: LysE family translocator [Thermoanaerobaculia bacterium]|nr:LysE family translocator [Thermoanaerobaculia bacterium]